eukprot:2839554-Alexandrium_andersonii.AAC.1
MAADADFKTCFPGAGSDVASALALDVCVGAFSLSDEAMLSGSRALEYAAQAEGPARRGR